MFAQSYAAILDQIGGDVEAMLKHTTAAAELCGQYGFAYYREWPLILAAWADRGVGSDSPARIERALDEMRSIRALARRPYYLSLLADAHQVAGDPRQARAVLEAALADAATSGEQWWVPELHRRLGTLDDGPGGEAAIRRAVDLATAQGAWSLALRAAISLARRAPSERPRSGPSSTPSRSRLATTAWKPKVSCRHRRSCIDERRRERFAND